MEITSGDVPDNDDNENTSGELPAAARGGAVSRRIGRRGGDWRRRAACAGRFDLDWVDYDDDDERQCRAICAACPVREHCLREALTNQEVWGIWGGMTPAERYRYAQRRHAPQPRLLPPHGTNNRYIKHHCRCDLCRAEHAAYERERRRSLPHRSTESAPARGDERHPPGAPRCTRTANLEDPLSGAEGHATILVLGGEVGAVLALLLLCSGSGALLLRYVDVLG